MLYNLAYYIAVCLEPSSENPVSEHSMGQNDLRQNSILDKVWILHSCTIASIESES